MKLITWLEEPSDHDPSPAKTPHFPRSRKDMVRNSTMLNREASRSASQTCRKTSPWSTTGRRRYLGLKPFAPRRYSASSLTSPSASRSVYLASRGRRKRHVAQDCNRARGDDRAGRQCFPAHAASGGWINVRSPRAWAFLECFFRLSQLVRETCVHEASADDRTIAAVNRPFTELL
jgi:hypothetical protein